MKQRKSFLEKRTKTAKYCRKMCVHSEKYKYLGIAGIKGEGGDERGQGEGQGMGG